MKKVLVIILIIISSCLVGLLGYNFRDYLFQKGLDSNEVSYKEITTNDVKDNKFNVYLFYIDGEEGSEGIKSYFNMLSPDLLDKFVLYTFEVSTSEENKNLLSSIRVLLNNNEVGTPFLIVGDQVMTGYSENDNIKINTLIENESKNEIHYDVLSYINNLEQE